MLEIAPSGGRASLPGRATSADRRISHHTPDGTIWVKSGEYIGLVGLGAELAPGSYLFILLATAR
jgi:hypothetical protein